MFLLIVLHSDIKSCIIDYPVQGIVVPTIMERFAKELKLEKLLRKLKPTPARRHQRSPLVFFMSVTASLLCSGCIATG